MIGALGSQEWLRIRIGVKPDLPPEAEAAKGGRRPGKDYLLSPMRKTDLTILDEVLDRVANATRRILSEGPAAAMNESSTAMETGPRRTRRLGMYEAVKVGEALQGKSQDRRLCTGSRCRRCGRRNADVACVYEVMFIVRPDVAEEDVDKLIAGFSTTVTGGGGVVKTVEKMGRRKLAYLVRKFNDGNYVLLTIEAAGARLFLELGAPPARDRAGDQVHHRAHGRRRQAPGQGEGFARRSPQGGALGSGPSCSACTDPCCRS